MHFVKELSVATSMEAPKQIQKEKIIFRIISKYKSKKTINVERKGGISRKTRCLVDFKIVLYQKRIFLLVQKKLFVF